MNVVSPSISLLPKYPTADTASFGNMSDDEDQPEADTLDDPLEPGAVNPASAFLQLMFQMTEENRNRSFTGNDQVKPHPTPQDHLPTATFLSLLSIILLSSPFSFSFSISFFFLFL